LERSARQDGAVLLPAGRTRYYMLGDRVDIAETLLEGTRKVIRRPAPGFVHHFDCPPRAPRCILTGSMVCTASSGEGRTSLPLTTAEVAATLWVVMRAPLRKHGRGRL
jgi:hypothetical protein